jgi:protein gp37
MGADSKIEWTHATFNPWWGCQRVSPGCEHCYAETFAKRVGQKVWGPKADRRFFGDAHWNEPLKWNRDAERAGERRRVFCASMADVFEDRRDLDEQRARLWRLIEATPSLDWLLLTKRPQNMARLAPAAWADGWPANVWAGTTVEDQRRAEERLPHLLGVPARIRFLSVEPQLGPVDLMKVRDDELGAAWNVLTCGIGWVIVGGESGPGARPFDLAWARELVGQCRAASVPCFVKQIGATSIDTDNNGFTPLRIRNSKGGDPAEWPADLRVREFPAVAP